MGVDDAAPATGLMLAWSCGTVKRILTRWICPNNTVVVTTTAPTTRTQNPPRTTITRRHFTRLNLEPLWAAGRLGGTASASGGTSGI